MPQRVLPADTPKSDGELFDRLHGWFGLGDFDPDGDMPWWKFRAIETGKIRRSRNKRGVAVAELYVAAMYCKRFGIDIRNVTWLYKHITRAWAWWESEYALRISADFEAAYAGAIEAEMAIENSVWLDRLLRAQGAAREEVFAQWHAARGL